LLIAIAAILFASRAAPRDAGRAGVQDFYSADDGKTWFADSADKPSPFEKNGRHAYRAYVWKSADGKKFVSHLERSVAAASAIPGANLEVKKPGAGDDSWVKTSTPAAQKVMAPIGPDGRIAIERVLPP